MEDAETAEKVPIRCPSLITSSFMEDTETAEKVPIQCPS